MITQVPVHAAEERWNTSLEGNTLRVPFLSYTWHSLWYRIFRKEPYALILSVHDHTVAPFIRTGNTVSFSGGEEIADYLDIIGPDQKKEESWRDILSFLKSLGVTQLRLRNVPESSPTFTFFAGLPRASVQKEDTTPILALPGTWEEYLATLTRKWRHELERKIRKVEREHPGIALRESSNPASDINTFLSLMGKDRAKQKFLTGPMKQFFSEMAAAFGNQLSLLIISLGDDKAAATLAFTQEKKYYLYNSGFDRTCCQNAGFYLKAQSIKLAIERGFTEYNFLQGSERYKYELGGKDFGVFTIHCPLA